MSRITTLWTLHVRAHSPDALAASRAELLYRYRAAAFRYVLAAVRDADAADDLAQDFALRFLRGDFQHADPGRGRFRDYLRTALSHLVTDYQRARKQAPAPLAAEPADTPEDADTTFHTAWRDELMERSWQRLATEQPTGHAVLRFRVEEPELTSAQMAERLTERLGRPQSPEGVRKALQRAHERFAELLLDEVAATLERPTVAELQEELQELGLTRYCRTALARWRE
ncbi:MAG TPA: hypothetical protein VLM40_03920 [Gemmata sp.]|nr:hypothetical protein [Gemmata sp.]